MKLKVSEIFYSLQGEGHRTGEASLFVRLQGCSVKHACFKSGVMCDTEFESGQEFDLDYKSYDDERHAMRQKLDRFDGDHEFFLEEES